ncbi:PD-(D/E)XK nuclease-like domain-containing protein [Nocardia wallacei]|uniref:PD-(D/E)XK nuclease-like domain-containing protein n=1 Tax=Nocardia wallacei TaxID=480035 RepID=UPI002456A50C|nr:PD-(D/E)XK nuclease-like domain-containing protein [Nocardia wallacei]
MTLDICPTTDLHVAECDCRRHRSQVPTAPGLYAGIPDTAYQRDTGSLSSSGARSIIFRSPSEFRHEQLHGRPPKTEYDEGHAAHLYVLGEGAEIEVVDADSWQTKAAKEARAAAYAAGKVPLLPKQDAAARAMAKVVLEHDLAGALFGEGEAELSGWWDDAETGVRLRLRMDWYTSLRGRPVVVDYKTSKGSGPGAAAKAIGEFGYYCQHPFYTDGLQSLGVADDPAFLFVFQCKTAPYRITVVQIEPDDVALGHDLNRMAIRTYAECLASGVWPDDSHAIHTVSIPTFIRYRAQELLS